MVRQDRENEVRVQKHDVWLTQKAIAQLFDEDYFEHLISEIQKITDIYAAAVDSQSVSATDIN